MNIHTIVSGRNAKIWGFFLLLAILAGILMSAAGVTNPEHFWLRQFVIWVIFPIIPLLVMCSNARRDRNKKIDL